MDQTGRCQPDAKMAGYHWPDTTNLPGFRDSIDVQKQKFSAKGLNAQDLVTLVGKDQCIKSFNKSFSSKYLTWLILHFN